MEKDQWDWFRNGKYGLFIHWGPASAWGRGEQILFREHLDQAEYERKACRWNPAHYDPKVWAAIAREGGMKYACLTTRHHDGYCLWDTDCTDYSSVRQAPKRDFVREFVDAFRAEGIQIGLYYSWLDWRIPAYFEGPEKNPVGWAEMKRYMHRQVEELLTRYGRIDYFFFDGVWPRNAEELGSEELLGKMRALQPGILINNRLGYDADAGVQADGGKGAGGSRDLGDFGTPERTIQPESGRLWESCQTSTWRLWGYCKGERWIPAEEILDRLCECVERGGNMILNVGPMPDGQLPPEFVERVLKIGEWLKTHGESLYGAEGGDVTDFITYGRQTVKGNCLYLMIRFWSGNDTLRLADLKSRVVRVTLLTTGQSLPFRQTEQELVIRGLPLESPSRLFPVIRVECDGAPEANDWGRQRLWSGDPQRLADWARKRSSGFNTVQHKG